MRSPKRPTACMRPNRHPDRARPIRRTGNPDRSGWPLLWRGAALGARAAAVRASALGQPPTENQDASMGSSAAGAARLVGLHAARLNPDRCQRDDEEAVSGVGLSAHVGRHPGERRPSRGPAISRPAVDIVDRVRSRGCSDDQIMAITERNSREVVGVYVRPNQAFAKGAFQRLQRAAKRNAAGTGVERLSKESSTTRGISGKKTISFNARRVSTVVVQRFCKPKVGGSNPSPGTNVINTLDSIFRCLARWSQRADAKRALLSRRISHASGEPTST
jgi:hypothetical protein